MKNLYLFLLLLIAASGFAQTPKKAGKADTAKSTVQRIEPGDVVISPAEFYGTSSVSFKKAPNQDIKIIVKDMSDKVVFEKVYKEVRTINFKVKLKSLQLGKYNMFVIDKDGNVLNKTEIESK